MGTLTTVATIMDAERASDFVVAITGDPQETVLPDGGILTEIEVEVTGGRYTVVFDGQLPEDATEMAVRMTGVVVR